MTERCYLRDVSVDCVTEAEVMDRIAAYLRSGHPHQIATVNLDFLRIAHQDAAFRRAVNGADLAVADGMPVVWLTRLLGGRPVARVTGVGLVDASAALSQAHGYRLFFLGSAPGVAAAAAAALHRRYPGVQVAGVYAPPFGPFSEAETAHMLSLVRQARPHFLFVAFGAPKQDVWISEHLDALDVPVSIGIGGSFDILAGRRRRAPRWMQHTGLEWAYRLAQEPARLWRRYLLQDLPVFLAVLAGALTPVRRRWEQPAAARRAEAVPAAAESGAAD
jgi:N-acetylglucosaminyldiphosphoundecaprenol N-acetyl-beta-D-mannosaminyltransferase